jgi:ABC-type transporter Mla MlaB component
MPWSPRHNHLRFAVEHHERQAIVRLAGELDFASAAVAHLALERAGQHLPEVTLDLSRVVFLDGTGVRFLINWESGLAAALSIHHHTPTEWSAEQQLKLEELGRAVARQSPAGRRRPFGTTRVAACG